MASAIIISGGGIKTAVAATCAGKDQSLIFLHVAYGQRAAEAEWEATQQLADAFEKARAVRVGMSYPLDLQQQFASESGAAAEVVVPGAPVTAGVVGSHFLGAGVRGTFPALVWAGVQCALRVGAKRVVSGISCLVDASHVGVPSRESGDVHWRELVQALSIAAESMSTADARMSIDVPLLERSYAEIVALASHMAVPVEHTWSCVSDAPPRGRRRVGCGQCQTCSARTSAFLEAHIVDPMSEPAAAGAI